jgi:hypothetical protein
MLTFCVEGFSAFLQKAQMEKHVSGVGFGGAGPTITHLLFADDSIVFPEASTSNLTALREILQAYKECSGQRVSLQKSSIFFGKGCQAERKEELKQIIGISCEAFSEKYLGLPTVVGGSKDGALKHIPDRSWCKVHGWKG